MAGEPAASLPGRWLATILTAWMRSVGTPAQHLEGGHHDLWFSSVAYITVMFDPAGRNGEG